MRAPAKRSWPAPGPVRRCQYAYAQGRLALRVLLRGSRFEFKPHEPVVSKDPRVVAGLDHIRIARANLELGAVVVLDVQLARLSDADVPRLAAVGAGDGLDALRPLPAGLEGHPGCCC